MDDTTHKLVGAAEKLEALHFQPDTSTMRMSGQAGRRQKVYRIGLYGEMEHTYLVLILQIPTHPMVLANRQEC